MTLLILDDAVLAAWASEWMAETVARFVAGTVSRSFEAFVEAEKGLADRDALSALRDEADRLRWGRRLAFVAKAAVASWALVLTSGFFF